MIAKTVKVVLPGLCLALLIVGVGRTADTVSTSQPAPGRAGDGPTTGSAPVKVRVAAIRVTFDGKAGKESRADFEKRGLAMAAQAAADGARFICLPENFLGGPGRSGGTLGPDDSLPDLWPVTAICKEHDCYIVVGAIDMVYNPKRKTHDRYFAAFLVGPGGRLGRHRKVDVVVRPNNPILTSKDGPRTEAWAGLDFEMHRLGPVRRAAVMICRDSFTNWAWTRVLSQDPQIIFHPNWRSSIVTYGPDLPAMAGKYGVPIVAADAHPDSESMIVDRSGHILDFEKKTDRILTGEVTLADRHPDYKTFPVLLNGRNRRK